MSSGNYTSDGLSWNNSSKPNPGGECVHTIEPSGKDVLFAGLCCRRGCGRATVYQDPGSGLPMHKLADLTW